MNIREALISEHSTIMRDQIVRYVGSNEDRMSQLMDCFFDKSMRINQRAAWPLSIIARKYPMLLHPYHEQIIAYLANPHHDAIIRNTVRIYADIDIPEAIEGQLCEYCFEWLHDPKQAVAIRIFSMTVLEKIVNKFPDLKEELIAVIQEHLPHGTSGFKSRGTKTLKRLLKK